MPRFRHGPTYRQELLRTRNAELAHFGLESRALHSELESGAIWPADGPIGFSESAQDVLSFGLFQSGSAAGDNCRSSVGLLFKLGQRNLKFRAAGQNDGALDEVFELADIAWPVIVR